MAEISTYEAYRRAIDSADAVEGMAARSEQRSPVWQSR
jgi:hypothetical protein